jgi:hypothetical protein
MIAGPAGGGGNRDDADEVRGQLDRVEAAYLT